ncbi:tyrosine-type recombinase/integrase [Escherichia coli]
MSHVKRRGLRDYCRIEVGRNRSKWVSHLYRNQIGDKFAQRLLGHKSDSMAARYRDSRGREWDKIEINK